MHFHTYVQKYYIQLQLLPHLIEDTHVTNMASLWDLFSVPTSQVDYFNSYQIVSVISEQFRNHSKNLLFSWA